MLSIQFFGQNIHFAINLFAALVFFAVFWLYLDTWTSKHSKKELFKFLGFLTLSVSFLVHATFIEKSAFGGSFLGNITEQVSGVTRLVGYGFIIIGLLLDPMQKRPKTKDLTEDLANETENDIDKKYNLDRVDKKDDSDSNESHKPEEAKESHAAIAGSLTLANAKMAAAFVAPLMVALLYWRRATTGLEGHLKPIAKAFFIIWLSELIGLAVFWRTSTDPQLATLVSPFHVAWIIEHVLLMIGVVIIGRWVWQYLTKRLLSQLFMVFTASILGIFLITGVSFTFLLMRNVQGEALDNLETASNVLTYAVKAKQSETQANAEAIANDPDIAKAVIGKDHKSLVKLTEDFLENKQQSSLLVTNESGLVLVRAEDPERWGDSLSSDTLVKRSLIGGSNTSVSSQEGVLAPTVRITSAVPIRDNNDDIVGVVVVGLELDSAFVDGVKQATGLDSAVYGGNVRSATTFIAGDGVSRWVGVKETDSIVNDKVLQKGEVFKGSLGVLNSPQLVVYTPLKDVDNTIVGMLFIGRNQAQLLRTAGRSIELTFILSVGLLIISIIPVYMITKNIVKQI